MDTQLWANKKKRWRANFREPRSTTLYPNPRYNEARYNEGRLYFDFVKLQEQEVVIRLCTDVSDKWTTYEKYGKMYNVGRCIMWKHVSGLDIGYVPAGPHAFFRSSGPFGPQQFILCWPAGPVAFRSVANACTSFFC